MGMPDPFKFHSQRILALAAEPWICRTERSFRESTGFITTLSGYTNGGNGGLDLQARNIRVSDQAFLSDSTLRDKDGTTAAGESDQFN